MVFSTILNTMSPAYRRPLNTPHQKRLLIFIGHNRQEDIITFNVLGILRYKLYYKMINEELNINGDPGN